MNQEEKYKITSNEFIDIFVTYNGNPVYLKKYSDATVHIVNENIAVLYVPAAEVNSSFIMKYGYSAIPKVYALTSQNSLEASGVKRLRSFPSINLRGRGVILGIIDTGIDYTNPVFQYADGTTKIISLWDQSISSTDQSPNTVYPAYYGTEYTAEQINLALKSGHPLQVVPSMDENGHGTMLAGIAAGSENIENDFSGVVPDAELIVVKLKQAKKIVSDFYAIHQEVPCFQENDMLWALQYLIEKARILQKPLSLCVGLGTSLDPHNDNGIFNNSISLAADFPGICICVSAGNEGDNKRHFYSTLNPSGDPIMVELNVGANEVGFSMELWGDPPTIYTIDITSPTGEQIKKISESLMGTREISFVFEKTVIYLDYILIEAETGKQIILMRFQNPTEGIWQFQIYGRGDLPGAFHIWLPSDGFVSPNIFFINSSTHTTVTSPGNCTVPITITAYHSDLNMLYNKSGRGYSATNVVKPELAAPGVDILGPTLMHSFANATGTGVATAHACGITAMILEWSIILGNNPGIDTVGIKQFLIRGAKRSLNIQYPNREWGYGILDAYNSFNILRTDILSHDR